MPHDIGISVSYPLPGTGFYEKVQEQLKEKSNWTHSDELALMFHNTYQPFFISSCIVMFIKVSERNLATDNLLFILKHPLKTSWTVLKKVLGGIYIFHR